MRGVHAHVGSQIMEPEPLAAAVAPLRALGEFEIYDLGGGLGARYTWADQPVSIAELPRRADRRGHRTPPGAGADHHRTGPQHGGLRGRDDLPGHHRQARARSPSSPSTAGWATTSRSRCSGSDSRPASSNRLDAAGRAGAEIVTVVGRHCESGDVLIDGVPLADPRVGDLLAVPATGAYCFTMSNNYNGNRRIPVVFAARRPSAARRAPGDLGRPDRARRRVKCQSLSVSDPWSGRPGDNGRRQPCLR